MVAGGNVTFIPVKDLEVTFLEKYVGRQYLDNTSNKQRSLAAYFVQDARVIYSLRKVFTKEISLIGQVNNMLNRKYNSNGYTYSYQAGSLITENFYFPMAGTNFMVALNIKL
ncbi:hypothetical protein [Paraflavitalea speifideaquila]|uniref:hypothetical protein n=1 Tax=Paraflavitalea speifideaquila TaxID=3076558 RepID=UPI003312FD34